MIILCSFGNNYKAISYYNICKIFIFIYSFFFFNIVSIYYNKRLFLVIKKRFLFIYFFFNVFMPLLGQFGIPLHGIPIIIIVIIVYSISMDKYRKNKNCDRMHKRGQYPIIVGERYGTGISRRKSP